MDTLGGVAPQIEIDLSWPAKELSPNNQQHPMVLHRFKKAAKNEAGWATKMVRPFTWAHDGMIGVQVKASPPKNWSTGDKDNFVSRLKAHFDGIAEALHVNDRQFESPTVTWGDKCERGAVFVVLTPLSSGAPAI